MTVTNYTPTDWYSGAGSKTVSSVTWVNGDVIIVRGSVGSTSTTLNTPTVQGGTGTGLTFTLRADEDDGDTGGGRTHVYIWTAKATGTGDGNIRATRSGGDGWGFAVTKLSGGTWGDYASSNTSAGIDADFSLTTAVDDWVGVIYSDWNAVSATGFTGQTDGSATISTSVNEGDDAVQGVYLFRADEGSTVAETANYGLSSYTGLLSVGAGIVVTYSAPAGGSAPPRRPNAINAMIVR